MNREYSELNRGGVRSVALVLALVTLLAYLPACFHDFISLDDCTYVSENGVVQKGLTWAGLKWAFTTTTASNWHPLTWISHMLDCQLFGLNPAAQHGVNVLFHAANTGLLFLLCLRLTRALWISALVAALFAWHPVHVESVAWISERKDVLSTFFGLLALGAYARYAQSRSKAESRGSRTSTSASALDPRPSTLDYWLALVLFALGLLAKPMLVTLPFVMLLLDFWPLNRVPRFPFPVSRFTGQGSGATAQVAGAGCEVPGEAAVERQNLALRTSHLALLWPLLREKWAFFLLSAASCVATFLAQRAQAVVPVGFYPIGARVDNAIVSYVRYLKSCFWPTDLAVIYPLPKAWPLWQVLGAAAILLVLTLLVWRMRRRNPYLLVGWLWFLGMLVPVIGLVQVGQQALADRYAYLPLVGIFLAVACGVGDLAARFQWRPVTLGAVAGLVLAGCLAAMEVQLHYWQNTITLLRHAIAVTRDNPFAHIVLSNAYAREQRWGEAAAEFSKAVRLEETPFIETAVERDYRVRTHLLLAQVLEMQKRPEAALSHYQDALRLDAASVEAHNNLGNLLDKLGRRDEAMAQYREALRLKPEAPLAHLNLGTLLIERGDFDPGMSQYAEAARLKPDDPLAHYLMAKAWLRHGNSARGVVELREAFRLNPEDFHVGTYLARVLAADEDPAVRNGSEAVRAAEQANALSQGVQPLVLDALAMAYAEAGRYQDAQQTVRQAIHTAQSVGAADWVADFQQRLELYQSGRPFREATTNLLAAPGARVRSRN